VVATDGHGDNSAPATATVTIPGSGGPPPPSSPSSPSGLAAIIPAPGEIKITWNNESAATNGFQVTVSQGGNQISSQNVGGTSYTANGLTAGKMYVFRVVALGDGGTKSSPSTVSKKAQ
jgi:hypothetical protein